MSFKIVKLTLRLVTPMVMAGADTGSVEFRIPEIKGLLRYWYRLRYVDMWDGRGKLHELGSEEARLFGSTSGASKIWLWGDVDGEKVGWIFGNNRKYLNRKVWGINRGRMPSVGEVKYWQGIKKAYPVGTHIHLNIGMKGLSDDEEFEFWKTVWALVYLGGIGRRWRRGLGSVEVVSDESDVPDEIRKYFEVGNGGLEEFYCEGCRFAFDRSFPFDVRLYIGGEVRSSQLPRQLKRFLGSISDCCFRNKRKVAVRWIKTFKFSDHYKFILVDFSRLYRDLNSDGGFINCHRWGRANCCPVRGPWRSICRRRR